MSKKLLSVFLALVMVLSLASGLPAAADGETEISSISISVTPPTAGTGSTNATPNISISTAGIGSYRASWQDHTGVQSIEPETLTFVAGNTYYALIVLYPAEGYQLKTNGPRDYTDAYSNDTYYGGSLPAGLDIVSAGIQSSSGRMCMLVKVTAKEPPAVGLGMGVSEGGTYSVDVTGTHSSHHPDCDGSMNMTLYAGDQVTLTAAPAPGYEFKGFYKGIIEQDQSQPGYGHVTSGDTASLVSSANPYTFTLTAYTSIYALFAKPSHTVTFQTDGLFTAPAAQTVADGGKATRPASPARDAHADGYDTNGLSFRGWYSKPANQISSYWEFCYSPSGREEGCIFDFDAPITKDTTAYAVYEGILTINTYDVTHRRANAGGTFDHRNYNSLYVTTDAASGYQTTAFYNMPEFLKAKPAEGYTFAGWSTSTSKDDIFSTAAEYEYTFKKRATIYALFEEKLPTLTLHASSVEGDDFVDPITIAVPKGTTIAQALEQYKSGTTLMTKLFSAEGYEDYRYRMPKPMSSYASYNDLWADAVQGSDVVNADMDIYYTMIRQIDAVEITYTPPVCGTSTTTEQNGSDWDWATQTNPPAVSLPGGVNYAVDTEGDNMVWSFWLADKENWDAYVGNFEGGRPYLAETWLKAAYGYTFSKNVTAAVKGGTLVEVEYDGGYAGIYANVTAVHDWNEWTETKAPSCTEPGEETRECRHNGEDWHAEDASETREAAALGHDWGAWKVTKEATETADGEETRTCARCSETETHAIPHLSVEYRSIEGDGATWEKGSGKTLAFTFKRNINDEKTFAHFTGALVDGKQLASKDYTAEAGSVIVTLQPAYLETLPVGKHTLTVTFDDGNDVSATFTIKEAKKDAAPSDQKKTDTTSKTPEKTKPAQTAKGKTAAAAPGTGDDSSMLMWMVLLCASLAGAAGILRYRKKALW